MKSISYNWSYFLHVMFFKLIQIIFGHITGFFNSLFFFSIFQFFIIQCCKIFFFESSLFYLLKLVIFHILQAFSLNMFVLIVLAFHAYIVVNVFWKIYEKRKLYLSSFFEYIWSILLLNFSVLMYSQKVLKTLWTQNIVFSTILLLRFFLLICI